MPLLLLLFTPPADALGRPDFAAREAAARTLTTAWPLSEPALWWVERSPDPEVRTRAAVTQAAGYRRRLPDPEARRALAIAVRCGFRPGECRVFHLVTRSEGAADPWLGDTPDVRDVLRDPNAGNWFFGVVVQTGLQRNRDLFEALHRAPDTGERELRILANVLRLRYRGLPAVDWDPMPGGEPATAGDVRRLWDARKYEAVKRAWRAAPRRTAG